MKYKKWLDIWLNDYIKRTFKRKTYLSYEIIVRLHVIPELGDYEMEELSPIILQRFISNLLSYGNYNTHNGLASNSVNLIINVLQCSLDMAVSYGIIKENKAKNVKRPRILEKQIICFTKEEQKVIEREILGKKRYCLYGIVLCLYTGLRIGELMALEWEDINFEEKEISVNKTCIDSVEENGTYGRNINSPKTQSSVRYIPIADKILPYLIELHGISKTKYVVENKGEIISVRGYQKAFSRLLERLGIEHKGFHSLRHTFATRAIECGMDVKTLSEILGHKNSIVTLNRYVHSLMNHKKEMINKVGNLL